MDAEEYTCMRVCTSACVCVCARVGEGDGGNGGEDRSARGQKNICMKSSSRRPSLARCCC